MSREYGQQVGITDPTLQWVNQAEALLEAPGYDPVTALLNSGSEELTTEGGYLISSTVRLGTGVVSTEIHAFDRGELKLTDPKDPSTMYGIGYAIGSLSNSAHSRIMTGRLGQEFSEYDAPGHSDITSGRAAITGIDGQGAFVATSPVLTGPDTLSLRSYNPLQDPRYTDRAYHGPTQLVRFTGRREAALEIARAIAQGADMSDVQGKLYVAKMNEQLHSLDRLRYQQSAAARRAAERGWLSSAVLGFARKRLGVELDQA